MNAGEEEDKGLLAQAEDDDNVSGHFNRRKACLLLSTDGYKTTFTRRPL